MPGAVTEIANNGLYKQAGNGCCNPENGDVIELRAQRLEDAAHIGILQGKAELDTKKSKTHVP